MFNGPFSGVSSPCGAGPHAARAHTQEVPALGRWRVSAAAAGGAAIGGLGAMASARTAPSREQDLRILGFLLGVERIELAFYEGAVRAGALRGELAEFAGAALIHERDHVGDTEAGNGTTAIRFACYD